MNSSLFLSRWGQKLAKKLMKPKQKYKAPVEAVKWNIVKGDNVQVVQGPQVGQRGKVISVHRQKNRVLIDGVNLRRRIVKPTMDGQPGKIITKPCTIHYSNVMLIDPTTNVPTRVGSRYLEDGTKVRVSKKSGEIIAKPNPLSDRMPRSLITGPKDTKPDDVFKVTFSEYEKYLPFIYGDHGKHEVNKRS